VVCSGFIEFIGFVGFFEFIGFIEFVGFVEFIEFFLINDSTTQPFNFFTLRSSVSLLGVWSWVLGFNFIFLPNKLINNLAN